MPYAVTLRLDGAGAAPVEAMWRALAEAGLHDDCLTLGYPPHLTLAVLPDGADPAALGDAVGQVALRWTAEAIGFAGFGLFLAPEAVLYLAPVVTGALRARQRELTAALGSLGVHPHYHSDAWMPHVTLAKGGAAGQPGWMGRAIDRLAPLWPARWPALADRLDLVRFRPVTLLASHSLPSPLGGDHQGRLEAP